MPKSSKYTDPKYVTASYSKAVAAIHPATLRNWAIRGQLDHIITPSDDMVTKSSKTLVPASTSNAKDLNTCWWESTKELSKKLWLPTETDYAGLDLTSLNGSLRNTKLNSWFLIQCQSKTLQTDSMNWLKTYLPSQITLWPKTMAFEQARLEQPDKENKKRPRNTKGNQAKRAKTLPHQTSSQQNRAISEELVKRKVVIGTKSVRLHPTPVQKKILKQWMGSYRYLYNQALSYTENHSDEPVSIKTLRRHLINDTTSVLQHPWLKEIPYDIKDEALRDFLQSYNSNRIKAKETKVSFKMKFKTKRSCRDSCTLLAKHWNTHKTGVYAFLSNIKASEAIETLPTDTRLVYEDARHFVLKVNRIIYIPGNEDAGHVITTENQGRHNSCTAKRHMVFLDPGLRTFMTGYDPEGHTFEWARLDSKRLHRLYLLTCRLESMVTSKDSGIKHRKRYRLRILQRKLRRRIRNLVDDCHYKLIKFLTETYRLVSIPIFKVSEMIQSRKIAKKTKQAFSLWSHFRFRCRLLAKAETVGCKVDIGTEEYTSRVCTRCMHMNPKSSSKTKKCQSCHYVIDRDVSGARNYCMKRFFEVQQLYKAGNYRSLACSSS